MSQELFEERPRGMRGRGSNIKIPKKMKFITFSKQLDHDDIHCKKGTKVVLLSSGADKVQSARIIFTNF